MGKFIIPSFYVRGRVLDFTPVSQQYGLKKIRYSKGEVLTVPGTINNTAHFVWSGIANLSLSNSSGSVKTIHLYGPNTIFPLGVVPHENPSDYEAIIEAFTDIEVSSFPYPTLRKMCVENGELAAELMEQNCESVSYLYHQAMNLAYSSTLIRTCDVLYIYHVSFPEMSGVVTLSQKELANLVGCSCPQLERILSALREEGIIATGRNHVVILDQQRLAQKCSDSLREGFTS